MRLVHLAHAPHNGLKSLQPRLIIVCGLPGSGKTSRAKALERELRAVRFSPDEWMQELAVDLFDEDAAQESRLCNGPWAKSF